MRSFNTPHLDSGLRRYASFLLLFVLLVLPGRVWTQISDVSDDVFSIVVPAAEARVVDMGILTLGDQRDTLVDPFVSNTGRARIRIDAMYLTGPDASAFDIVSGRAPVHVPEAHTHPVGFSFHPRSEGVKNAVIVIETQIDTQYYDIRGEAIAPRIALETMMIDFGAIPVGAQRDSTLLLIRNLTAGPVTVEESVQGGPDTRRYSILDGAAPFDLPPYGSRELTLRFDALYAGRSSGTIDFAVAGSAEVLTAHLFGEGIARDAMALLATDVLEAAPGEIVRVPIRLADAEDIQYTGAHAFTTELRFRASLLVPFGATPKGRLAGEERIVTLENLPIMPDADGVLAYYDFIAVLGDAETTPLHLQNSAAIGAGFTVLESPGAFRLIDICREGGDRFFDSEGQLRLEQNNPNPFNTSTVITFETIEAGSVQVFILDALGRRVRTLVNEPLNPGIHYRVLNLRDAPSGQYICILRTPTSTRQIRMQLLK